MMPKSCSLLSQSSSGLLLLVLLLILDTDFGMKRGVKNDGVLQVSGAVQFESNETVLVYTQTRDDIDEFMVIHRDDRGGNHYDAASEVKRIGDSADTVNADLKINGGEDSDVGADFHTLDVDSNINLEADLSSTHLRNLSSKNTLDEEQAVETISSLSAKEHSRGVYVEQISWKPRAYIYHNFLSEEECDHIIHLSEAHLERSSVIDSKTGKPIDDPIRTSFQTFLGAKVERNDTIMKSIDERISRYTGVPVENGESLQVLRYQNHQMYDEHLDVADKDSPSGKILSEVGGQRMATVLLYLSDVEEVRSVLLLLISNV